MLSRFRLLVVVAVLCLVACGSQAPVSQTPVSPAPAAAPEPAPAAPPPEPPAPPVAGLPEVFVGAGDIAACTPNSEATARLLDAIDGTVFTLGDNAYPKGAELEFRMCYDPTWGRHKARTRPSPGNHEYESPGAAPYFAYFGANAGPPGLGYYSFNLGAWHLVSLNSNVNVAAQAIWLQNDLDVHRHRCVLAYWHHPLYSSGPEGETAAVRDLWRVLYRHNAELVLSSHDHMYERFAPQDHEGQLDLIRGIRQFVVGTGGAELHGSRDTMPNSEMLLAEYGVLKLTLSPDGYAWEFMTPAGVRDSGSGSCR